MNPAQFEGEGVLLVGGVHHGQRLINVPNQAGDVIELQAVANEFGLDAHERVTRYDDEPKRVVETVAERYNVVRLHWPLEKEGLPAGWRLAFFDELDIDSKTSVREITAFLLEFYVQHSPWGERAD